MRKESISIKDFMDGNYGKEKARRNRQAKKSQKSPKIDPKKLSPIIAVPATLLAAMPAAAQEVAKQAGEATIQMRVANAFEPLVDLAQGVSYPLALVMIIGGCLFIMIGNKDKGFSMIQMAGIGYILCQIAPLIMGLLVDIASAL